MKSSANTGTWRDGATVAIAMGHTANRVTGASSGGRRPGVLVSEERHPSTLASTLPPDRDKAPSRSGLGSRPAVANAGTPAPAEVSTENAARPCLDAQIGCEIARSVSVDDRPGSGVAAGLPESLRQIFKTSLTPALVGAEIPRRSDRALSA